MKLLKYCIDYLNSFIYGEIEQKLEKILEEIEKDQTRTEILEKELEKARIKIEEYKNILVSIGDTIPDMMWAKSINGQYLYANSCMLDDLFYGMDFNSVIGKTDIELVKKCKKLVGDENHTFGQVCGDSDLVVLKNLKKERFLEWGLINGKEVYLEVYKAPFYKNGEVIGVVGTGRDVTKWYISNKEAVLKNECNVKSNCYGSMLLKKLDKYKFET